MKPNDEPRRLQYFVPDGYPTFRPDVSVLFGEAMPRLGVHSDLVAQKSTDDPVGTLPVWQGGRLCVCERSDGRIKNLLLAFFHNLRTLRQARRERYQAIIVRDMAFFSVPALWWARWQGLPLFFWMSFPMSESSIDVVRLNGLKLGLVRFLFVAFKGYAGRWLLYRYVLPRADHVFVQSDQMRRDVAAEGIAFERMTPVPMGADMERIDRLDIQPAADPRLAGKRVLVYLGTLDRTRRIDFLFRVLKLVLAKEPNAILVLAGEAPEQLDRDWLQSQAVETGVEQAVIKTGWLPTEAAWQYVKAAEIGLSPFRPSFLLNSTSPTKVVEYLALGIPAVANEHPDQAKVLGESGAGLCVPYEEAAFAEAVLKILGDPALAGAMRLNGPAYVRANRSYTSLATAVAGKLRELIECVPLKQSA